MKNACKFFALILAVACYSNLNAQAGGAIWVGNKSTDPQIQAVQAAITNCYEAFIKGDFEKGWTYYSENAAEVDPGGNLTIGKKALKDNWDAFMKMADETPKFTYSNVQVRLLTNDVALAVWDSEADIKIGGQQLGGKTKGLGVMHKINGQWKLEIDSITPVMPMPETK